MQTQSLGAVIRHLREKAYLSQEELAGRAEVSRATIQNIENDRGQPRRASLRRIAAALGTDVTTLNQVMEPSASAADPDAEARLREELQELERERVQLDTSPARGAAYKVISEALDAGIAEIRAQLREVVAAADRSDTRSEAGS